MELGADIYFEIPTVTTRYSKTTTPPPRRGARACREHAPKYGCTLYGGSNHAPIQAAVHSQVDRLASMLLLRALCLLLATRSAAAFLPPLNSRSWHSTVLRGNSNHNDRQQQQQQQQQQHDTPDGSGEAAPLPTTPPPLPPPLDAQRRLVLSTGLLAATSLGR